MSKAKKNLADLREARLQGSLQASQGTSDEPDGDFEVRCALEYAQLNLKKQFNLATTLPESHPYYFLLISYIENEVL